MTDEDYIARVARALCVADGNDPEAEITVGIDSVEDDRNRDSYHGVTAPAWGTYAREARRLVAALRTLGLLE